MAHDLTLLLNKEQLIYYHDCIMEELAQEEAGLLINQTLEHSIGLTYEQVRDTWQAIADVFQKAIEDE